MNWDAPWPKLSLAKPATASLHLRPRTDTTRPLETNIMQTHDLAPHLANLKRQLGTKIGTEVSEEDLKDELAKYLEYGVPIDQAVRTVLRHHGVATTPANRPQSAPTTNERLPLAQVPANSAFVNLKARVLSINTKKVNARGEEKDIVFGFLGDESGSLPYTAWRPLEGIAKGDVVAIEGAYTKEYQGKAQVNFGDRTKLLKVDDDLPRTPAPPAEDQKVADLREGLRGIRLNVRILSVAPRQVNVQGVPKTVWGGTLADASGQCEFSSWHDHGLKDGMAVTIEGGYVRSYRGMPQFTFDQDAKVTPYMGELPDAARLAARAPVTLGSILEKGAGNDVQVAATLLEVRPGSGLVMRCSTAGCSRVLTNGMCRLHNRVEGVPDLRIKAILDDGTGALSAIVGRELTETLLGKKLDQCVKEAQAAFRPEVVLDQLKEKLTARVYVARGNVMSDEYGPTMIVRGLTPYQEPKEEAARLLLSSLEVA